MEFQDRFSFKYAVLSFLCRGAWVPKKHFMKLEQSLNIQTVKLVYRVVEQHSADGIAQH